MIKFMDDDRIKAEFNSSLEYLRRINEAFELANFAQANLNGFLWVEALAILFKEFSTQMKADEISKGLLELNLLVRAGTGGRGKGGSIPEDFYWRLFSFELMLRRVYKDSGLEMKYSDEIKGILFKGGA